MIDANDKSTIELIPTLKKRGRPSTGKAKTGAQRQAKLIRKREDAIWQTDSKNWTEKECLQFLSIGKNAQYDYMRGNALKRIAELNGYNLVKIEE